MSAVLAFVCGLVAGWLSRRAYVRWRASQALSTVLRGLDPGIVKRAP